MQYQKPRTLAEAAALLADGGILLAGGTQLVPVVAAGNLTPNLLIDIRDIDALKIFKESEDALTFGAIFTLEELEEQLKQYEFLNCFRQAVSRIGNPNVRRCATLGGNIARGLPLSDLLTPLAALDAKILWYYSRGVHELSVNKFLTSTDVNDGIITGVKIPKGQNWRSGYIKYAWRNASAQAIAAVAVALQGEDNFIVEGRVAALGINAQSLRCTNTEKHLKGVFHNTDLVEECVRALEGEVNITKTNHCSAAYRRHLMLTAFRGLMSSLYG